MRRLNKGEKTIDIVRESADSLRLEEWTFHMDGSARAYAKASRLRIEDEWRYSLLTFPDFPNGIVQLWKEPSQDVVEEARQTLKEME